MSHSKLTNVPLVADDDEESDACSKAVEHNHDGACHLNPLAAHRIHNVLVGGAVVHSRAVDENEQGADYEDHQNLENTDD